MSDATFDDILSRAKAAGLEEWDLMFRWDVCAMRRDWMALHAEYQQWFWKLPPVDERETEDE